MLIYTLINCRVCEDGFRVRLLEKDRIHQIERGAGARLIRNLQAIYVRPDESDEVIEERKQATLKEIEERKKADAEMNSILKGEFYGNRVH